MTEVVAADFPYAVEIETADNSYFVRQLADTSGRRDDGYPVWMKTQFNLFPIVIDSTGTPWAEATVFMLSKLENSFQPKVGSLGPIANDLAAFRRFLDDTGLEWTEFPEKKLARPTYRYLSQVRLELNAGEIAVSTAKRRMSSMVAFYRWWIDEKALVPAFKPWNESVRFIEFTGAYGFKGTKKVTVTDMGIYVPKSDDPYSECIEDGGKLRPLPETEQRWLLDALARLGNTELTLIHLLAILSGARLMTVLTLKLRHVTSQHLVSPETGEVKLPVGPGTGVDTKNDKQMVLHIPAWFYGLLSTYGHSERAAKRRRRAEGGDTPDQYFFVTSHGNPFYRSKAHSRTYDELNDRSHAKEGGAVQQLIREYLVPLIQADHDRTFKYRFHDLRATYGMNLTDEQLKLVAKGEITLSEAREFVRVRMGHSSHATTDLYLKFRGRLKFSRQANNEYSDHLKSIATTAINGIS